MALERRRDTRRHLAWPLSAAQQAQVASLIIAGCESEAANQTACFSTTRDERESLRDT